MVHLAQVKNKPVKEAAGQEEFGAPRRRASVVPGLEHISLEPPGEDEFSTSVYGSRFAAEDLPSHEMPEKEMPKEVAYRMIKDELSLDGNPMLK
jgi:glutamate decarboxylase